MLGEGGEYYPKMAATGGAVKSKMATSGGAAKSKMAASGGGTKGNTSLLTPPGNKKNLKGGMNPNTDLGKPRF